MNEYQIALNGWKRACRTGLIDVVDERSLQELVDKATPKKLDYEGDGYYNGQLVYDTAICRNCGRHFEVDYDEEFEYCPTCGQKLDWSKESE